MECPTTPKSKLFGLGCFRFARHYSGNRICFLFLRVLRCFSSPGLPYLSYEFRKASCPFGQGVSPFGNLRIKAYLRLPGAYRSSFRPSSAPSAKASTVRSLKLNHLRMIHIESLRVSFATSRKIHISCQMHKDRKVSFVICVSIHQLIQLRLTRRFSWLASLCVSLSSFQGSTGARRPSGV